MNDLELDGIAIIGVHGRFPGAGSAEAFWANLVAGRESITHFTDDELRAAGLDPAALRSAGQYVAARGVLEGAELFDAGFFGIQPKEAEVMDPQHRVFLEACWEALERVGYPSGRGAGSVGVYAGASNNTYYLHALHPRPELRELVGSDQVMLGNEKDYLATRVAYKLGLRGPAITLNTACSSSMVSVCMAQQALLTYQCDLAIAGGVSIIVPQQRGYYFQEGSIGAPDGHTRTFDADAKGVVPGNGITLVVLKRLADAVADGDDVLAVIKGAALNNDGSQRAGFGAPGVEGQSEVIALAQDLAGFEPETISYIEAHGTATPIGDPIEIAGLTKAFRRKTQARQFCAIGSVKTNIGHLDAAAGTAGLIKAALALKHRVLPPSLHFKSPNPRLDLGNSPFFVNAALRDWQVPPGQPRRAGVSSFGIGGTNSHVVLEEPPARGPLPAGRPDQVLVLSAKSPGALEEATRRLAAHLRACPDADLSDVACTLQLGRVEFAHRRALACDSVAEAAALLEQGGAGARVATGAAPASVPSVVFLFPGQGAQHVGMAAEIYRREPLVAGIIDECSRILEPIIGVDLRKLLHPAPGEEAAAEEQLRMTRFTQPALFVVEYALARLWISWGIRPSAMMGHSVGEYVAACLAGVFPMEVALRLVARRAALVQAQAPGTMLAVRLSEAELRPILPAGVDIAAVNAASSCVASGPLDAIVQLEERLAARKAAARRLATSHAFHSAMMEPVVSAYLSILREVPFSPPSIPYVSNVTGRWVTQEEATSPEYWAGHVRQTVRFADGLGVLLEDKDAVFIESGPSQTLWQLVRQHPAWQRERTVVSSLGNGDGQESVHLRTSLGRLWAAGVAVDWAAYQRGERRRRVVLPTYPFERKRYWPDSPIAEPATLTVAGAATKVSEAETTPVSSSSVGAAPVAALGVTAVAAIGALEMRARLGDLVRAALHELSGAYVASMSDEASLLELGLDSLMLTQAATLLQRRFGVPVAFRQLMEGLSSIGALTAFIDERLPTDRRVALLGGNVPRASGSEPATASVATASQSGSPAAMAPEAVDAGQIGDRRSRLSGMVRLALHELSGADLASMDDRASLLELGLDSLMLTQAATLLQRRFGVQVAFRQLMEGLSSIEALTAYLDERITPERASQLFGGAPTIGASGQVAAGTPANRPAAPPASTGGGTHGPFRQPDRNAGTIQTDGQRQFLNALIERYTRRTAGSKQLAAQNRRVLADPRSAAGFKDLWKEMVYPLYTNRSDGARVWDVDGHEYVDFVMGFGANLFGHRPPFVVEAIRRQLEQGFEVGPIQPLVGEAAELVSELTGMERVAFCNTGSEAVLAAMRLARTVSGRDVIGVFSGAYHGIFDEVLVRPLTVNGEVRAAPIAPGTPSSSVSQMRVFDWAKPESLELIRKHGSELAAILVEPVQTRRLDVQPREFLMELRRITEELGIALIFDEVVTGFRYHQGGAQAWYGIRADLASYGKVVGGGLPIGVVAGKPRYLDALDGGAWQFGDASFPQVGVTFFAGTFVRHPITMAVALAVLRHLKSEGPGLQMRVSDLAERMTERCRDVIARYRAPLRMVQASSMMFLTAAPEFPMGSLLFYLMRERGIHVWENRAIVMTTAHTEDDANRFVRALDESLAALVVGGFLEAPAGFEPGKGVAPIESRAGVTSGGDGFSGTGSTGVRTLPLTDAQREVWLAALLDERASRSYNLTFLIHLSGPLDRGALRRSVQAWADRHDAFRTSFDRRDAVQRIATSIEMPWVEVDGNWVGGERETRLRALAREQGDTPIDLTRAPLSRFALVRCGETDHVLILTISHLIADGWSFGVLLHELKALYGAEVGKPGAVLQAPLQYAEYRLLQDSQAVRESARASRDYWHSQFTPLPPVQELPSDRIRPPERTFTAGRVTVTWDGEFVRRVRQASARQGSTLLVYLLGSFKVLMRRLCGQGDLVVGVPAAGQIAPSLREPPGNRALVGHCVHVLPIRTQCELEQPFDAYLKTVKSRILDAFEHQDLTFGQLAEFLNVPRDATRVPLAPIIFNVDRAPAGFELAGLATRVEELPRASLVFDLSINIVDDDRSLRLDCDFNADAFDAPAVERWMSHYRTLVEAAIARPATPVGSLSLLGDAEREQLLELGAGRMIRHGGARTIHGLFEEQARRTPGAIAVEFGEARLTYAQLDGRANALAARLRSRGAGVETLVGICVERSLDLVVGVLGIMKSGAAYVPLDPAFPKDRLAFMVEDAQMPVIVTQSRMLGNLPSHRAEVVTIDDLPGAAPAVDGGAGPDNLSYVIYTSGSTGKPKGVEVMHRGGANLIQSMLREPGMDSSDVLLAVITLSFDMSVYELFLPLSCGARLVVASQEMVTDGERLIAEMERCGATVLQATPTTWRLVMAAGWKGSPKLKILCGGEAFPPDLARQLLPRCGSLWNVYGPTETTVYSTCFQVREASGPLSIGRPLDNTTVRILDASMDLVPVGVLGELWIGGDGLARGYRGRPELTDSRFMMVPTRAGTTERLYRTGDQVRWSPDGNIAYLGRLDHQVKLRGFRIELGEIEAVVSKFDGVGQCVAMAREDRPGDARLVIYVEPRRGQSVDEAALRRHARESLPDYMVPQHFVVMPALPLTPNGKINRRALPPPSMGEPAAGPAAESPAGRAGSEPPRTKTEIELARLWRKVLGVASVGRDSSFFDLGGHSLLAVMLFADIEATFGRKLPLATIMRSETLSALASEIDALNPASHTWRTLVPVRTTGSRPPFFCVHGGGGQTLFARDLVRHFDPDLPFYSFQALGVLDFDQRDETVEAMAEHYLEELLLAQPQGPYYVGGFCLGGLVAFEMAQRLRARGLEVGLVVLLDTYNPAHAAEVTARVSGFDIWLQKARFMWGNFRNLPAGERRLFIRRRLLVTARHRWMKLRERLGRISSAPGGARRETDSWLLEDINDHAAELYRPKPYSGDVVVVRPHVGYKRFDDPQYGWSRVVTGRLDVANIRVNPGGMVHEPYVGEVGRAVSAALKRAQSRT